MLKQIDLNQTVTFKEAKQIILANRSQVFLLQAPMGGGKSALRKVLEQETGLPSHVVHMTQLDVGDIKMPVIKDGEFKYSPNADLPLHTYEPKIVFFEEWGKAPKPVQDACHEYIEPHHPSWCGYPKHPDCITVICSNLAEEGVGDRILDHTHDRLIQLVMTGANHEEMIGYAIQSGWHETVIAFMHEFPEVLLTILDGDAWKNSPYKGVTRRGLEGVSDIMHSSYGKLSSNLLSTTIAGRVGSPFAKQFQAFVDYKDQVPTHEEVIKDPTGAKLPKTQGAACVFVFGAITKVDKSNIDKYMKYFARFEPEWQMMFSLTMAKQKQGVAFNSPSFRDWLLENSDLI
jgi:hypothetical protein